MKLVIISLGLLLLVNLPYCSDQQLAESRVAEKLYAELLYNIYQDSLSKAQQAGVDLSIQLNNLQKQWRRPMNKKALSDCRFRLDRAHDAFSDVKYALEDKNLKAAKIHLDRATYELAQADEYAFTQLYLGTFYNFFANWQEVRHIVNDQMLCLMEWNEFVWWVNLANSDWLKIKCINPNQAIYAWKEGDWAAFRSLREELDNKLEAFWQSIPRGDQCLSQEYANEANTALWELIRHFGVPRPEENNNKIYN